MKHAEESKSLRVPAAELFQTVDELLQSGKTAVFQVSGQSMWPLICGGRDSVEVERAAPDALRKGDIVLLRTEGGDYLLHRIVRLSGDGFETAGDGNLCEDEMVFPYACLHARVARVLRPRVTVRCRGPLWRTASYLWMKAFRSAARFCGPAGASTRCCTGKGRSRMKICFFSGDITRPGGTEKVCIRIASALAAKGYDVTILSAARGRAEPFFPIPGSVTLVSLGETFPKPGPGWLRIRFRLDRFLRRQRFDFLVDVDGVLDLIALGPARRAGTRLISWEHFGFEEQFGRGYRRLAGRAARRAFAVVALTESGAAEYEKRLKAAGKVVCIPNPAPCPDMGESGAEQKEKLILSVGRLCAQKGFDMLADCAALVLKTHGDWRWSVVGEGGGRAALEKRTRELGLEGRLTFPGADRNMAAWYARSSIFVMTSRFEGLPVALMEAMAYGLPAVAFDVPTGPRELLTGRRGCALVPPFDVEKMAAAVCRAIDAFPAEAEKGLPGLYAETAVTEAWERLFRTASAGQGNR